MVGCSEILQRYQFSPKLTSVFAEHVVGIPLTGLTFWSMITKTQTVELLLACPSTRRCVQASSCVVLGLDQLNRQRWRVYSMIRVVFVRVLTSATAVGILATGIDSAEAQAETGIHKPPAISFDNPAMAKIGKVYRDALRNLLETNTVRYQGDRVIRAGANYPRPWTRDGSLNSMMAGSLLEPTVAESTLWHITDQRRTVSGQWWDRLIWVAAAWHHYKVTGDMDFLAEAYVCAKTSLENHRRQFLVPDYGLFRGPSHLCDGIAGYPDPPAVNTDGGSSYCEDYPNLVYIMPTSLQAIYFGAYQSAADMGRALDCEPHEIERWRRLAAGLKRKADQYL